MWKNRKCRKKSAIFTKIFFTVFFSFVSCDVFLKEICVLEKNAQTSERFQIMRNWTISIWNTRSSTRVNRSRIGSEMQFCVQNDCYNAFIKQRRKIDIRMANMYAVVCSRMQYNAISSRRNLHKRLLRKYLWFIETYTNF